MLMLSSRERKRGRGKGDGPLFRQSDGLPDKASKKGTVPFSLAGMLRRLSRRRLLGEGLSGRTYTPGDTVIVAARRGIGAGEVVLAEIGGREALYRHGPGTGVVRFASGDPGAPIQVPVSDLRILGVVIGLRRG